MALQIKKKNLGSDQVDGSKILLAQGQAIRGFDQNGVEKDLIEFGESGEILVNGSEVTYKSVTDVIESDLSSEESARIAGDVSALAESKSYTDGKVNLVLSNLDTNALDSLVEVVGAFQQADQNLNNAISGLATELDTRIDGVDLSVGSLEARMFSAEGSISSEVSRATSEENALKLRATTSEQDVDSLEIRMLSAEGNISSEVSRATSEENALKLRATTSEQDVDSLEIRMMSAEGNISSEVSRATSEENALKLRVTTSEQDVDSLEVRMMSAEGNISSEVSRATSEENALKLRATTSEQDVDSLEVRMLSAEGSISSEVSNRTDADTQIRLDFASADAAKLVEAKAYADQVSALAQDNAEDYTDSQIAAIPAVDLSNYYITSEVDELIAAQEAYSEEVSQDSANAVIAEQTRALAAEASLQSQITNVLSNVDGAALDSLTEIVTAFEVADSNLNGAITSLASSASSALSTEQAARIASDAALQGEIDAEEVARAAADTTLQNNISSEASARASAISSLQSAVDAEEVRAMGVEAQLQSDHDDLDGYAQDIRSDVDDLDGYAQDIRSDLDSEISRAQAAESSISSALSALSASHDSRLDVLEAQTDGPFFHKMKIEISTNLVYVELAHEAIANSIVVSVGRLMAHKDEDFTVSVVGGVTHLTWIGSMVSPDGVEAIESGDKVFVTYAY